MTTPAFRNYPREPLSISVGICAHNEEKHISTALDSLLSQSLPEPFVLQEILVVASGCTDGTEDIVQDWSRRDPRIVLLRETYRSGKARALNRILARAKGDIIVSLNADARLAIGALASLLAPFSQGDQIVIACGAPILPDGSESPTLLALDLQWRLHNRTLGTLSELRLPNHCCDEFMALRRGFVGALPDDLINDGAYLGTLASLRGISVLFCREARVHVDPPSTLDGYILQRRRILRGHQQVLDILGRPPNTLENLILRQPALASKIVVRELFGDLRSTLTALLLLVPLEGVANLLARLKRLRGSEYEPVWRMVT